jgi:hypothetical protein
LEYSIIRVLVVKVYPASKTRLRGTLLATLWSLWERRAGDEALDSKEEGASSKHYNTGSNYFRGTLLATSWSLCERKAGDEAIKKATSFLSKWLF